MGELGFPTQTSWQIQGISTFEPLFGQNAVNYRSTTSFATLMVARKPVRIGCSEGVFACWADEMSPF
jgi:hypothetical protein